MTRLVLSIIVILLSCAFTAYAADFVWAKGMGDPHDAAGRSVAVDSSGNVHTVGSFLGSADFDPGAGTPNLTAIGYRNIFVSKLDSSGAFVWAKQMGGNSEERGISVAVDSSGNVYITGSFQVTVDFDPGVGTYNLISAGADNIFVSKLSGPPTVSMTSSESSYFDGAPIPVTVTFSIPVTGFTAGDLVVTNGTVTNFAGSGTTYTFEIVPTGSATITADIAGNVALDSGGDGNASLSLQFTLTYELPAAAWPLAAALCIAAFAAFRRTERR